MNRNLYKKMKNYKEIKEFNQNGYIRIAYMNELYSIEFSLNIKKRVGGVSPYGLYCPLQKLFKKE